MTPERFQKMRDIFAAALEHPSSDRSSFLKQACGPDEVLRQEVQELLAAHNKTSQCIDSPALEGVAVSSAFQGVAEGVHFGPYRVVRELGHGGMGSVYLADRMIGKARQLVAIKVVRPGWTNSAELVRRFEQEREILASLDHPNIARLLDIGTTANGLPYLVMEYVEGEPIDISCDRRELTIAERLGLFRTVCGAVQYAHSKGVIHRDLKPNNNLVTSNGSVKLLDFGIAKVVHTAGEQTQTLLTHTGWRPMTVEYASPEQIKGGEVTAATDVYSLGVLLYFLLTGRWLYNMEGRLPHDIFRAICEDLPLLPSLAVCQPVPVPEDSRHTVTAAEISAHRRLQPKQLQRCLRGDLDSIVMKALRKEPKWRYESAEQFSDDVRRYLAGEVLLARKRTFRYKLQRAAHRVLTPPDSGMRVNAGIMAGWGMFGVLALVEKQLIALGWKSSADMPYAVVPMIMNIVWSIREGRRIAAQQKSPADRHASTVFAVTLSTLMLLLFLSAFTRVIPEPALALFWNAGLGMAFLITGLLASRLFTGAGAVLLLSVVLASLSPFWLYTWLACGLVVGCVIPGVILAFQNPEIADLGTQFVTLSSDGPISNKHGS